MVASAFMIIPKLLRLLSFQWSKITLSMFHLFLLSFIFVLFSSLFFLVDLHFNFNNNMNIFFSSWKKNHVIPQSLILIIYIAYKINFKWNCVGILWTSRLTFCMCLKRIALAYRRCWVGAFLSNVMKKKSEIRAQRTK